MCSFYLSDCSLRQKQTSKEISAEIWTNSRREGKSLPRHKEIELRPRYCDTNLRNYGCC